MPTAKWPRLDRFVEHNIELPVATFKVSVAAREAALRDAALDKALEHGQGRRAHRRHANAAEANVFSTKRACPNCGTGFPELDPRLFSYQFEAMAGARAVSAQGLQLPEFDAEQSGEETVQVARRWKTSSAASANVPTAHGRALESGGAVMCLFRDLSIAALTDLPVKEFARHASSARSTW